MHKNGISKNTNLLENIPEKVLKYITKKWIEVHDQSDNTNDRWKSKHQCYIHKGTITVTGANNRNRKNRSLAFKKMLHLLVVYQRSIMY